MINEYKNKKLLNLVVVKIDKKLKVLVKNMYGNSLS